MGRKTESSADLSASGGFRRLVRLWRIAQMNWQGHEPGRLLPLEARANLDVGPWPCYYRPGREPSSRLRLSQGGVPELDKGNRL